MNKKKIFIFGALIMLLAAILLVWTRIPHRIVNKSPDEVSVLIVRDRSTGVETEITSRPDIEYILSQLNYITFKREGLAYSNTGDGIDINIYDTRRENTLNFIMLSENTIIYKGFKYKTQMQTYAYIYVKEWLKDASRNKE